MKLDRVMLAAPKSGSGKTSITCALLQALKDSGRQVVSFKCGPDYIDPMFHRNVLGVPSKNLDTFFTGEAQTKRLFLKDRKETEFAVMEGVMGLFDGLGGVREEGSSYHLAKVTRTPIVMVVDAKGMGRSVIPLLAGFLAYDREKLIKGVILNRVSKGYYDSIKPYIEAELPIQVLGFFPEQKQFSLESRHLGLILPDEISSIGEKLKSMAAELQKTVQIEQLVRIGRQAEPLNADYTVSECENPACGRTEGPVIAVARDEAFCFYYEDNLLLLEEYGAKIQYFSPLQDAALPEACSGILLGGGYPELYAERLSQNTAMLHAIRQAMEDEMPVVAECGGFMYLHAVMEDKCKTSHAMAGALAAKCYYTGKLVRFGYIELKEQQSHFLPEGETIRGHEFHYFDSEDNGDGCLAVKPVTGKSYPCVVTGENYFLGFPHLYYPSNPAFAERFVRKAEVYSRKQR